MNCQAGFAALPAAGPGQNGHDVRIDRAQGPDPSGPVAPVKTDVVSDLTGPGAHSNVSRFEALQKLRKGAKVIQKGAYSKCRSTKIRVMFVVAPHEEICTLSELIQCSSFSKICSTDLRD